MPVGLPRAASFVGRAALVAAVAAGGWWTAMHGAAGVRWAEVTGLLHDVSPSQLGLLGAVWLGGLGIYALVLTAALPGLGLRRGLLLNLSGSAVANVVPLGGVAATALNWRMVRIWGYSNSAFVAFCVLTKSLDVAMKLLLSVVTVVVLVVLSVHVPIVLLAVSIGCIAALAVAALLGVVASRRGPGAQRRPSRWHRINRLHGSAERIWALFTAHWSQLLAASIGYIAAQVALLDLSLGSVGLAVPVATVLTAAAIDRLGSLFPFTPGGTGVAEIGVVAWLIASGFDPVKVVAGVLVFRIFLVAMEIPLGGVLLGGWAWAHRVSTGRRPARAIA